VKESKQNTVTIPKEEYEKLLKLESNYKFLQQEMEKLKKLIFGAKSERFVSANNDSQLHLPFGESQTEADEKQDETPEIEEINYSRKKIKKEKKAPVRAALPSHLPRKEEIIEPLDKNDTDRKIGEDVTEILEYNPSEIYVRRIVRPKYARKNPETIVVADLPSQIIPRSNAGHSLIAQLIVSKFIDHLPIYRQLEIFKRQGIKLPQSTVNSWQLKALKALELLYDTLLKELKKETYLQADETPLPVLTKDKPGSTHKGYFWVYNSPLTGLVAFNYDKSRGQQAPKRHLLGFSGTLQCDGYVTYDTLAKSPEYEITLAACWAHARRKFQDALSNDKNSAGYAMSLIQELYRIERDIKETLDDDNKDVFFAKRKEIRQTESVPVLAKIKEFLDSELSKQLPKSLIGKAIAYTLNLWKKLNEYTIDGRIEIDNNLIENKIRPVALGRKNYMFAGSHEAAQLAAMAYSFFASCKQNDVNPYEWLKDIFDRILDCKGSELHQLLPNYWKKLKQ